MQDSQSCVRAGRRESRVFLSSPERSSAVFSCVAVAMLTSQAPQEREPRRREVFPGGVKRGTRMIFALAAASVHQAFALLGGWKICISLDSAIQFADCRRGMSGK